MTGAHSSNVIVEAEGVLIQGAGELTVLAGVPARRIFLTAPWLRYARGELTEQEAYEYLSVTLGVRPSDVADAVSVHRQSWQTPPGLLDLLDTLQDQGTHLYCLVTMPPEQWKYAREHLPDLWSRFTGVVTTGELGTELASLDTITRLCRRWSLAPHDTTFIGADLQTLQFTRAAGIHSIRYQTPTDLWRLRSEHSRLQAAEDYVLRRLRTGDYRSHLITSTGEQHEVDEIWSPFYLLDASTTIARSEPGQALLRQLASLDQDGLYSFLRTAHPLLGELPVDADDTGLAVSVLHAHGLVDEESLQRVAERILANSNRDGIVRMYFAPQRPRVDSVVCAVALYILYLAGRHDAPQARATEDFLHALLENKAYEQGTIYTPSPDFYLYVLFRIARRFPRFRDRFHPLLATRLTQRIATTDEPAGQALRVIMCRTLNIDNDTDYRRLLAQQHADGSWDPSPAWRGIAMTVVGYNRSLDTTFAAQAIRLTLTHTNDDR
ncbi:hypothetical protein ACIGQE_28020 [Streptomyces sp. NPDC053429]|uniref:hypothetical protein n=1 Tax=Streptomyces sp. NPDC053429 TaxID=3365702 RepID=UPI0037D34C41